MQSAGTGAYTIGMREAPDDAPNDLASARSLTTAAPVSARFDYAGDSDRFHFNAVARTTYTVTVSADSGSIGSASSLLLKLNDSTEYRVVGGR